MYEMTVNGTASQFTILDEFADAVADAINEWLIDAECERFADSDVVCCGNHSSYRFEMCNTCDAIEQAECDYSEYWSASDVPALPYELRLPATDRMDPVVITARAV